MAKKPARTDGIHAKFAQRTWPNISKKRKKLPHPMYAQLPPVYALYARVFYSYTQKKLFDAFFLLYTTKPTNLLASFCHEMSAVLTTNLPSIKKNFDCFEKMGQESPSPSLSLLSGSLHFLTGIKVRTHTWSKNKVSKRAANITRGLYYFLNVPSRTPTNTRKK